jgi:U4/U6.U5 tri-snRNP-associated protein 2
VNRSALDFDFEKCCSVTLSPLHCYACLVCGKYFQGRGPATVAYTHALEAGHHVFMKLADGRVYCLPDGYEVLDRSLDDIRHVLDPRFGADALVAVDTSRAWSSALDGSEYLPGVVGLNNVKATDYVNVVLQALMRVKPLRDAMLRRVVAAGAPARDSPVLQRFGELTRKVWNPRNFKGQVRGALVPRGMRGCKPGYLASAASHSSGHLQVSPHEFLQAVVRASNKRFLIDRQGDPVEFLAWFLHELHRCAQACVGG